MNKIHFLLVIPLLISCSDKTGQGNEHPADVDSTFSGQPTEYIRFDLGNQCFADIERCDISGNYSLIGSDLSPVFYSASLPITQDKMPLSDVVVAPYFYFYTGVNTYIFRGVGTGTWDGDSLKVTIHGKLRLSATGYPSVGGFAVAFKLDAKQKTFTNVYYYSSLMRLTLPALDGEIVIADTAHVVFPVTNTKAKVLFTQF